MQIDEDLLYREVGARLREQRMLVGLTQERLAERSGISRASIAIIERGKQRSPLHVLYRLCAALDIETASLIPLNKEVGEKQPLSMVITDEMMTSLPRTVETVERLRRILEEREDYDTKS
jgi:transcriptional regulator with XRE-family HTH domain